MPGQLYHTNEILVLLGDNWFAKRTAHQASDIVERRKQGMLCDCINTFAQLNLYIRCLIYRIHYYMMISDLNIGTVLLS